MTATAAAPAPTPGPVSIAGSPRRTSATQPVLEPWIRAQGLNLTRHTKALRDFTRKEFGTGPEAPTEGHVQAVNQLLAGLRRGLTRRARRMNTLSAAAAQHPSAARLTALVEHKHHAHDWVKGDREDLGLLLRAVRPAAVAVRRLAAQLRPDRAGLLPVRLPGARQRRSRSRRRRRSPTCAPASRRRRSGAASRCAQLGPAAQPVPADPAAVPPAGQPLDTRRGAARGQPQPAERPRADARRAAGDRAAAARGRAAGRRSRASGRAGTARSSPISAACCSAARRSSAR